MIPLTVIWTLVWLHDVLVDKGENGLWKLKYGRWHSGME